MQRAAALAVALVFSVTTVLAAKAPFLSIRPKARPVALNARVDTSFVQVFYGSAVRPKPRGQAPITAIRDVASSAGFETDPSYQLATTAPVFSSPRPPSRPSMLNSHVPIQQRVVTTTPVNTVVSRGSICGDRSIKGQVLAAIPGRLPGCGVAHPVKVTQVDGVTLSQAAIMDCQTAEALKTWITRGLRPAVGRRGGGVKSLRVAAHYACRTRNNKPGAKISEHGKGHAIDISAINLNDGTSITVLDGWNSGRQSTILRKAHRAACGPFGTVLGPSADRYHRDHFHLDTARYRGGPYCQ